MAIDILQSPALCIAIPKKDVLQKLKSARDNVEMFSGQCGWRSAHGCLIEAFHVTEEINTYTLLYSCFIPTKTMLISIMCFPLQLLPIIPIGTSVYVLVRLRGTTFDETAVHYHVLCSLCIFSPTTLLVFPASQARGQHPFLHTPPYLVLIDSCAFKGHGIYY